MRTAVTVQALSAQGGFKTSFASALKAVTSVEADCLLGAVHPSIAPLMNALKQAQERQKRLGLRPCLLSSHLSSTMQAHTSSPRI